MILLITYALNHRYRYCQGMGDLAARAVADVARETPSFVAEMREDAPMSRSDDLVRAVERAIGA